MKTYEVVLEERLTYNIEVEANSADEAESLAYDSDKFTKNVIDDNDTVTKSVIELTETDK